MIETFSRWIVYSVLQIPSDNPLSTALDFFIYDTIKILLLMLTVVFVITFIQTFLPLSKVKNALEKQRFGLGYLAASSLGAISPFCSCSSIPLFMGFLKAKMPLGIAFAFLTTSPLVNEIAFIMMGGLFGWKVAFWYAAIGILLGIFAGIIIDALHLEKEIILSDFMDAKNLDTSSHTPKKWKEKIQYAWQGSTRTLKKMWLVVVIGIGIGAFLHGYIPKEFLSSFVGKYSILSVPIAVLIGIPIYAGCSTAVPIIFSLNASGIPLGTSLAFLMAIAGLSLPEGIMLRRVISTKLLAIFFSIVGIGIMFVGYIFNIFF